MFLSGAQALARLPYEQLRIDRAAGWNTAAYVTGYQGSPLASYDRDISTAAALAAADGLRLVFQPGMNEELAATAVMGSQLSVTLDSCRYDGVIGIWYGKAPGLDRASDALRHAVFAGTSSRGGAVALVGDDPSAKSSTLPSSSDATLVDLHIPVLFPGDVQEAVDLGRHAIALSRASGLWTSIKIVEAVADGTGTVELHPERIVPVMPTMEVNGKVFVPLPSGRLITPYTLDLEREFQEIRLELARRYSVENNLNTVSVRGPNDWIGIAASGHTFHEMREALRLLGLRTDDDLRAVGVRLMKLGLPVPLDRGLIRAFAAGLTEVIVVEDKNPTLEWQVVEALYSQNERPVVCGKHEPDGSPMLPSTGSLTADIIAPRLRARLVQRIAAERLAAPDEHRPGERELIPLSVDRTPFFCSGCPHNTSTRVPDHSLVGGGIGCHTMVMLMEPERFGHIVGVTAMGNEGAQWFGMAPFVDDRHLFQNIGDGTLFHSGMLAVRAAVANGVNITYKVLYNGAVAMTGGQDAFGQLDVAHLSEVFLAEGVRQVLVTADDVGRYRDVTLPPGVDLWDRSRIIEAQERLRKISGTTVLILSNCLSVQPIETPFGRKTTIDQATCNFDASCVKGDCPSFLTVTPRRPKRSARTSARHARSTAAIDPASLPPPIARRVDGDFTIRLSGIGGTGVVTVSQILGTAAMIDGYQVRGLDQTGLSQKAGPVVSDIRLSRDVPQPSNRATAGSVDTLLAFDLLVAASEAHIGGTSPTRTAVIASTSAVATGSMVVHPETPYPHDEAVARLRATTRLLIEADALGHIPIAAEHIEQAIELNGVAVGRNLAAFRLGRRDGAADSESMPSTEPEALEALIARLVDDLTGYQSAGYARQFSDAVDHVATCHDHALTRAVATNLHKLMAYKDEYEVARLLLRPESRTAAESVGGRGAKVQWNLHPPLLRAVGLHRKIRLGRWARPMFVALRGAKRLRGTVFDPFGHNEIRRIERAMVPEFLEATRRLVVVYRPELAAEAIAIASLPDQVRGYEHLKLRRATAYRVELAARLTNLEQATHRGAM
ncbi:MAG: putative oxidoreductase [Acidimicrobiaceae bacterium]|nr:MAG: putative oxidoreductase [Acidimicrobiaceae bacterium]